VQAEDDGRETRYRLLETLREFAADQLRTEERDETGRRHAEYYKKLAETAEPHVNGGPLQTQWLDRLEVEHENLRAALTWLQERRHAETGLEFAAALQMFWTARGHLSEGRERLTELLELPESAGKAARARALTRAAAMANRQGDHAAAQVLCERSLEISRKLGHRPLIQQGLFYLGNAFIRQDDPAAAQAAYAESLAIARELDDRLAVARTLRNLGLVARRQGDRPAERALTEESLPLCRELGAHWDMAEAMINLGQNARSQGDDAAAHSFLQESLAIGRELGSQLLVGDVLYFLGLQEQERGDPERAWGYYQESLTHKRGIGDR
jgi:tetratricopeptide (TPR) repeat protein